ncbi:Zn-ribbon domain-containing OB-fold protein [Burkholderia sp. GS2Y]|uniref:OB-fold domain-containing protein n=1 Tax=Burkholderia theae TaxID=3143496 RepID=A0ABU9WNA9_9BURK
MTLSLLKPTLYQAEPAPSRPSLRGMHCGACGHAFFPPQDLGCERCGAVGSALQPRELAGSGTLMARVTVHVHAKPERPAPFVIGTVRLDDGPMVRTLLDASPDTLPPIGSPMVAVLSPVASAESPVVHDLRFSLAQPNQSQE